MTRIIERILSNINNRDKSESIKVAIYCRVSTSDQTPENQRLTLTEYAERQGWKYDIFTEVQSTRKTRPVKAELLNNRKPSV